MVNCRECGKEIETIFQNGKYISGCWSAVHEPPHIHELEPSLDDVFPITGLDSDSAAGSLKSYLEFWS